MALDKDRKLRITPQGPSKLDSVVVLFNPTFYTITKDVEWEVPEPPEKEAPEAKLARTSRRLNAPPVEFKGGKARTLTMDLLFDVTEQTIVNQRVVTDVRQITNGIVAMSRIEPKQKRPPICIVEWGFAPVGSDFPFKGFLSHLKQEFLLFRDISGEPMRSKLEVTFTEFLPPTEDQLQTDPELTTRRVRRGDSLQALAADVYRDPSLWRVIAEANGMDDPRRLDIGRTLTIPQLA